MLCFKVIFPICWRLDLTDVSVKCGEKGHYANHCKNRNVPGYRGGVERSRRFAQGGVGED